MADPLVISVILNTNRRDDTLACLASLARGTYTNHKVLVLDNASTDGSVPAIRAQYPAVEIVPLESNLGYAGNNNVGIALARAQGADWIFVLNEDTVLAADCLELLVQIGQTDHRIGIVGPMVYHHDEPEIIQSAGGVIDRYWRSSHAGQNQHDDHQYPTPRSVDWISGCSILLRRELVEEIGGLDERFFYYWEEVDLCLRGKEHGWQLMHVPAARIWHRGVQRDYQPKPTVTYYSTRNRLLLLSKHRAPLLVKLVAWGDIVRTLISWTVRPRWRAQREHRNAMWRGALSYLSRRWGPASN